MVNHTNNSPTEVSTYLATAPGLAHALLVAAIISTMGNLTISFFYNWGFFFALDISFDTAPLKFVDYVTSWSSWLHWLVSMFAIAIIWRLWASRKKGTEVNNCQDQSRMPVENEIRNVGLVKRRALAVAAIGLIWFVGRLWIPELSQSIRIGLMVALFWIAFVMYVFSYPGQEDRYGKVLINMTWIVPIVAIFTFFAGWTRVESHVVRQIDQYEIVTESMNGAIPETYRVEIVRIFSEWMIVCYEDGKSGWINLDKVERINLINNVTWIESRGMCSY